MRTPFASDNWEFINGKWVELNPKTKKPFTKEERKTQSKLNQGRYPGSLDPKIKGEFASKGNLPEWALKNVSRPVGDALTDAVNMLQLSPELSSKGKYQSKFQQKGPAKVQRSLRETSELFAKQQSDAQKFFGTGEFASKDDIKNRYLSNTSKLKEIKTTVNTDNSGNTDFASEAVNSLLSEKLDPNNKFALENNPWGFTDPSKRPNYPLNAVESKQSPKLSKEEWLAKEGTAWELDTKHSPAAQTGAWETPGERWAIQKKAREGSWDKKYDSYLKRDETPEIKKQELKSKQQTLDTTSTNIGAKDLAGKLGGDFGKAYKMVQTAKALASVAKGTKLATAFGAGGAGAAALGPLGIAAAVAFAAFAKKGEKEGSPNLYQRAQIEDPLAYV